MIISLQYRRTWFPNFVFPVWGGRVHTAHLLFWTWFWHPPHNYKIPKKYDPAWDCLYMFTYMWASHPSIESFPHTRSSVSCLEKKNLMFLKSCRHFNISFFSAFLWCVSGEKYSNREYGITAARLSEYISVHRARFPRKGSIPSQVCPKNSPRLARTEQIFGAFRCHFLIFNIWNYSLVLWQTRLELMALIKSNNVQCKMEMDRSLRPSRREW